MERRTLARRTLTTLLLAWGLILVVGSATFMLTRIHIMPRVQPLLGCVVLLSGLSMVYFRQELSEMYWRRPGPLPGPSFATSPILIALTGFRFALGGLALLLSSF